MKIPSIILTCLLLLGASVFAAEKPNIVLVMTDDQGWGQVGYMNHPHLKTPNLDAMAANGLRFDHFYAGGPVCSPTRASVLTGRTHFRTGVESHGYPLRHEEKTVAQALKEAGYATGHFGKWHLDGLRGAGVPILADDPYGPGAFGFDTWLSVTNFFDLDPLMSRQGEFEQFEGDSSEIAVAEALKFIEAKAEEEKPSFSVIWFGSPHSPMRALEADRAAFADLPEGHQEHLGELVAMDRAVGNLRDTLRELGIAENTLVWFNSDNGGLKGYGEETVGGLRGWKGSMQEGGIRVPGIIEWPAQIEPRITQYPAGVVDIFPTIAEIVGLPDSAMLKPQDGMSLVPLFSQEIEKREKPLGFRYKRGGAIIDWPYKIVNENLSKDGFLLYDLEQDPHEDKDLSGKLPEVYESMRSQLVDWNESVMASVAAKDYPGGKMEKAPEPKFWRDAEGYQPYLEDWKKRPEYERYIK